jgi:hypothetical protein
VTSGRGFAAARVSVALATILFVFASDTKFCQNKKGIGTLQKESELID